MKTYRIVVTMPGGAEMAMTILAKSADRAILQVVNRSEKWPTKPIAVRSEGVLSS